MITNWLSGYMNYSYQELKNTEIHEIIQAAPKNKFTAGLEATPLRGLSFIIDTHYVDKIYTWNTEVDDYILTNARIGYDFEKPNLGCAVSVFNLFDVRHREHPLGEEIGQRILFTLSYNF